MEENAILIGHGSLSWPRIERVTDRYGYIGLYDSDSQERPISDGAALDLSKITSLLNKTGRLIVKVCETRTSTHIGDLFRGFRPITPEKDEEIELGNGKLSHLVQDGVDTVGLIPEDGRGEDWLNPERLYRAHEQTVNLYFIPA